MAAFIFSSIIRQALTPAERSASTWSVIFSTRINSFQLIPAREIFSCRSRKLLDVALPHLEKPFVHPPPEAALASPAAVAVARIARRSPSARCRLAESDGRLRYRW